MPKPICYDSVKEDIFGRLVYCDVFGKEIYRETDKDKQERNAYCKYFEWKNSFMRQCTNSPPPMLTYNYQSDSFKKALGECRINTSQMERFIKNGRKGYNPLDGKVYE